MANTCESVQGPSLRPSQMRLIGLYQKVKWQESRPNDRGPWPLPTRSNCRCLRSRTPKAERGNPVSPPGEGQSPIFPPRLRRNGVRRPGSVRLAPMAPIFSPLFEAGVVPGHSASLLRQADRKEGHRAARQDAGRSECRLVMRRIRVGNLPGAKASRRPAGALLRRSTREIVLNRESDGRRRLRSTACAPSPLTLEPDDSVRVLQSPPDLSNMPDRSSAGRP